MLYSFFFFFQAEDGIRDGRVTGVQTCALRSLFREAAVTFDQVTPLGELTIRWTGTDEGEIDVSDEFDELHPPESEDGEAPQVDDHPFLEPGSPATEDDTPEDAAQPSEGPDETVDQ